MDRYHPGFFGKLGMRFFRKPSYYRFCPTINVDKVWTLLPEAQRDELIKAHADGAKAAPVIDVTRFGYHKVLGGGVVPSRPVIVKARFFTKEAEQKIRSAGGVAVLTA
jgi:large subunit ribosomal protein L27Ae